MTNASIPTVDQVLAIATRLPRAARVELITRLVQDIAVPETSAATVSLLDDQHVWDVFFALADDPTVQEPLPQDSATLITEMRR